MTPLQVRLILGVALALVLSVAGNLLLLQDRSAGLASGKAEAARVLVTGTESPTAKSQQAATAKNYQSKSKGIDQAALADLTVPAGVDLDTLRAIQRELALKGYEAGASDGRIGLITRAAIMAYEADYGLPLTAEPGDALLRHIILASAARPSPSALPPPKTRTPAAEQIVRTVQQSLAGLGYYTVRVDGSLGEPMARAIREFEMDNGLPQTGRISGTLLARLARAVADGRKSAGR